MQIGQGQEVFLGILLCALCGGIGAASMFPLPWAVILAAVIVCGLLSAYGCYRAYRWTGVTTAMVFFLLGMLRFVAADSLPENDISHFARETVKVEGILREEPRLGVDGQGGQKQRYLIDVTRIKKQGADWQKGSGGLYIYTHSKEAPSTHKDADMAIDKNP